MTIHEKIVEGVKAAIAFIALMMLSIVVAKGMQTFVELFFADGMFIAVITAMMLLIIGCLTYMSWKGWLD